VLKEVVDSNGKVQLVPIQVDSGSGSTSGVSLVLSVILLLGAAYVVQRVYAPAQQFAGSSFRL
jgi:hypothetical protein